MLRDYWYIACTAKAAEKKPVAFTAFDTPLVAFTGSNGKPGVLIDRCAHRNAPLSEGFIKDGALLCPYHGWAYDTKGRLLDAPVCPSSCSNPGAIQPGLKNNNTLDIAIDAYPCVEQDGYIWFCLSQQPATEAPVPFAHFEEPGWTSFKMDTLFDGPVPTCLENFLDCPHATFVHKHWFRTPTTKNIKAVVRTNTDGAEAEYFDEPREASVVWSMLTKSNSKMRHIDRFIAPATTRVDYEFSDSRYYVITSSCTPVTETQTRVHTVVTFRFGRIGKLVKLFFKPLSKRIIKQDVDIVRQQQANIERFNGKRYKVIEQDLLYRHIIEWRRRIEKGGPAPEARPEETIELVI